MEYVSLPSVLFSLCYRKMDPNSSQRKIEKKSKPSDMWTFNERYGQAKDFLRFLETEKIHLSGGIGKKKVQKLYNKEYKAYREQIAPNEKLIPYHVCLQTLYNKNVIHLEDSILHKGPRPSLSPEGEKKDGTTLGKPTENKTKTSESGTTENTQRTDNQIVDKSQQTSSARRRARRKKARPTAGRSELQEDPRKAIMTDRLQRLRRRRQWPVKVAVDQHLTMHRPEPQADDSTVEQGASVNVADRKYIKKLEDEDLFACRVCHTTCTSEADVERHLRGKVHRLAVVIDRLKTMRYLSIILSYHAEGEILADSTIQPHYNTVVCVQSRHCVS